MKRLFAVTCALCSTTLSAEPIYHPSGANLTYGASSNPQTVLSSIANPAAAASVLVDKERQYRFGILSSIGVGYEVGKVDNFTDDLDRISNLLDANYTTVADADNAIATINSLLPNITRDGHLKLFTSGHFPIAPIVLTNQAINGSLVFDLNLSVAGKANALDAPIIRTNPMPFTYELESESSILIQGAGITEVALGYSRPFKKTDSGTLFGGIRGKYYDVDLTRGLTRLVDTAGDSENVLEDKLDDNLHNSSDFGIDLGILWVGDNYRVGGSWININEPGFDFAPIDLSGYSQASIINSVGQRTEYTMESQLRLEAALYSASKNWVVNATLDANDVVDPFNDAYKWATVSAAYATDSWLVPGARIGYRSNLAGTKLDYLTAGLTLFKILNLDLAYGLDSVTIDNDSAPQSFLVNLGLELTF